ncbi:MAG TPA: HipA domain-containing protein [Steroidobacteraceae bacterium]|nr:HipA domain-containing protein [Steroidobacteraceae bacterium]
MPSDNQELWVWNTLPAESTPVLCGRFQWTAMAGVGGSGVGRFVYARAYLDRSDARPIDPVLLPLRDAEFTTTSLGGIFSAFHDAGPDSWGRFLSERLYGPRSELGYLLLAAGERTGTLDFSIARETPPPEPRVINGIDELAQAARAVHAAEGDGEIPQKFVQLLACGTSNGGARPKFTLLHEGELWIAKLPSQTDSVQYPSMPLRECAALDLAARCGIEVPQHQLVDAGGVPALLVRRFDRRGRERLPYASARTVAWSNPEVMRYSYMASYTGISQELARWIRNPADDRRALYERVVFNAATGNGDDHDANHGLVLDRPQYGYRLAPLFDPVASTDIPAKDLAMAFGEDGRHISRRNLLSRPGQFGLDRGHADDVLKRIGTIVTQCWREILLTRGADPRQVDRLASWFDFAGELAGVESNGARPRGA